MACPTNQLGSIVSTSRETLDEGKVIFGNNINNVHYKLAYSTPGYGKNVVYNEPRTFGIRAGVKF